MFLAKVNTTSLSQLTGKMPPANVRSGISQCVVHFMGDADDKVIGFGVSLLRGIIAVHMKILSNATKYKIAFEFNGEIGWAELKGIQKEVALMQVSRLTEETF